MTPACPIAAVCSPHGCYGAGLDWAGLGWAWWGEGRNRGWEKGKAEAVGGRCWGKEGAEKEAEVEGRGQDWGGGRGVGREQR